MFDCQPCNNYKISITIQHTPTIEWQLKFFNCPREQGGGGGGDPFFQE
jgi:hypothetical protein